MPNRQLAKVTTPMMEVEAEVEHPEYLNQVLQAQVLLKQDQAPYQMEQCQRAYQLKDRPNLQRHH